MMTLSLEQEIALIDALKQLLGKNSASHNREIRWDSLPQASSALAVYDVETLRFYTLLLASSGFLEDFADHGETFSIRRGNNAFLSLPGMRATPRYRKHMKKSVLGHVRSFAVMLVIVYLLRLAMRAFLMSLI